MSGLDNTSDEQMNKMSVISSENEQKYKSLV